MCCRVACWALGRTGPLGAVCLNNRICLSCSSVVGVIHVGPGGEVSRDEMKSLEKSKQERSRWAPRGLLTRAIFTRLHSGVRSLYWMTCKGFIYRRALTSPKVANQGKVLVSARIIAICQVKSDDSNGDLGTNDTQDGVRGAHVSYRAQTGANESPYIAVRLNVLWMLANLWLGRRFNTAAICVVARQGVHEFSTLFLLGSLPLPNLALRVRCKRFTA